MLGKIKGRRRRGDRVGWHHRLNGHEFEQTGKQWRTEKPGVLQSMGSRRVRHWATEQKQQHGRGTKWDAYCFPPQVLAGRPELSAHFSLRVQPLMGFDSHVWVAHWLPAPKVPSQGSSCVLSAPRGAPESCKLLQLLLPTQIALLLLTTQQTSCLCLINKLLYLFKGVNL